jgi:hypothetical protein
MKNKYAYIMKTKYGIAFLFAILISIVGCDKGFVEVNKDPLSPTSLDPAYLFAGTQSVASDEWHYEAPIVQQLNLIILGQEAAGNMNIEVDSYCSAKWNSGFGRVKTLVSILETLKGTTDRTNLLNMTRIMKAYTFMVLVDTYGDVPYKEAGLGYYTGNFFPKYDNQKDIYLDIEKELKEATDGLDATKDAVTNDMYFKGNIASWKKFGNSLLLRLGMRYSKSDPTKAAAVVAVATDATRGGVMTVNADNVVVPYNGTQGNPANAVNRSSVKQNWHVGRPFVDFLKTSNDPRMPYLVCLYADPNSTTGGTQNTTPSAQIGSPFGLDPSTITTDPLYPGTVSSGIWKYSMMNRQTVGRVDMKYVVISASEVQLNMAEARFRNWISTSTTQAYYENAITQAMSQPDSYSTVRAAASPITTAQITAYLTQPTIAYNVATALKQINEQYWVSSFLNFHEAWCNFRRSGYPVLTPTNYPGQDPAVTAADGFIHRMAYPTNEFSVNKVNAEAAAAAIANGDNLGSRVFWDTL